MRKEIGGYIELDKYTLPMLHEEALALNCGRNCLAYLIEARGIRKLYLPRFICDSVINVAKKYNVIIRFYNIDFEFEPYNLDTLQKDEWLYLINYYGQFDRKYYEEMVAIYERVIVDQTHSYFDEPISGADSIYTCRKYFGVANGAFLYTNSVLEKKLPVDESFGRMKFVLGRFERSAEEFFGEACYNNAFFDGEPIKTMSKLTKNLLHGINYNLVESVRVNNFRYLHKSLEKVNMIKIRKIGTFMYPFMVKDGEKTRKKLQNLKIYIPKLWPEVRKDFEVEYALASNIIPLPIDQRYDIVDMKFVLEAIESLMQ